MFEIDNWAALAVASGSPPDGHPHFTLWLYRPEVDDLAAIVTRGYFDPLAGKLHAGDLILVSLVRDLCASAAVLHVCGVDGGVEVETLTPTGMLVPPLLLSPSILSAGFYVSEEEG